MPRIIRCCLLLTLLSQRKVKYLFAIIGDCEVIHAFPTYKISTTYYVRTRTSSRSILIIIQTPVVQNTSHFHHLYFFFPIWWMSMWVFCLIFTPHYPPSTSKLYKIHQTTPVYCPPHQEPNGGHSDQPRLALWITRFGPGARGQDASKKR